MRNLSEIAKDIQAAWKNPNYAALPYIKAMLFIHSPEPNAPYLAETARDIVLGFLCNASTFRGETARELKKELKQQYKIA